MTRFLRILFTIPALLPLWALYPLSSAFAWLMGSVFRYRRCVVMANLRACFPDKSEAELRTIARQFYRNFADSIIETVKVLHISDEEMRRRMQFDGIEIVDRLMAEKRNIVVYFAHTFNWEWAPSVTMHTQIHPGEGSGVLFGQIYRPLRNKAFD
ncbi:MAG: lysophospholipid acyltransferase family protein, partial [Muribaculaceae bacterium]